MGLWERIHKARIQAGALRKGALGDSSVRGRVTHVVGVRGAAGGSGGSSGGGGGSGDPAG